jgi:hypothetical protein
MSRHIMLAILAIACCVALVGCSTAKAPAEAAIKAADEALAGIKSEASVYIPEQLKGVEDALASAKDSFQKGEYQQALTAAKDLAAKAKDLATAVAAKKDELTKAWQEMSGGLPGMVNAIQSRVTMLSKSRKLPAGLDKDKFESAKASVPTITQTLAEASDAFKNGNLMDAVSKAKTVKEKATEVMNALGMKVPEAAMK